VQYISFFLQFLFEALFFLPGTLLHEISHLFSAALFAHPTNFSICPRETGGYRASRIAAKDGRPPDDNDSKGFIGFNKTMGGMMYGRQRYAIIFDLL